MLHCLMGSEYKRKEISQKSGMYTTCVIWIPGTSRYVFIVMVNKIRKILRRNSTLLLKNLTCEKFSKRDGIFSIASRSQANGKNEVEL